MSRSSIWKSVEVLSRLYKTGFEVPRSECWHRVFWWFNLDWLATTATAVATRYYVVVWLGLLQDEPHPFRDHGGIVFFVHDAVVRVNAVGLAIVHRDPAGIELGEGVRITRIGGVRSL